MIRLSVLLAASVLAFAANSAAAIITIAPDNVTASSEIPGFDRIDDYIVDGSGLSGDQHGIAPDGSMWLSSGTAFGGDDPDPSVTFDLGGLYTITSFQVWNYNEFANNSIDLTGRGVNGVTIHYGLTNAFGSSVPGITAFARADATATYTGEVFNSFPPFDARFIKFDIDSNHGGDNNFYGLSEVRFDGTPVPEPASLALLALVGLMLTPRKR